MEDTVLVTGGAGFIGSYFVHLWLKQEAGRVVNFDKLTYAANPESLDDIRDSPRYEFVRGDICDPDLVLKVIQRTRPRAVIHFAAETHVDRSIDSPQEFVQTNVVGTVTLLEQTLHYWRSLSTEHREKFRFVHVSTDEVYGSAGSNEEFSERSTHAPSSPYAASKSAAGQFVQAFHKTYGLPTLQTCCSNNFGPFQFPEKLIPLMTLNAVEGKPLPIYGDGLQSRDWLHVQDHCSAVMAVLAQGVPGESYNVAGGTQITNLELVRLICQIIDEEVPDLPHAPCSSLIQSVVDRPGHDVRYAVDTKKIRKDLSWQPGCEFESVLKSTVLWYLKNTMWVERVNQTYDRTRLGLN